MGGWNYVLTAHKPTNVTHSCVGSFTNPLDLNLIIGKCTSLEIHLLTALGLQLSSFPFTLNKLKTLVQCPDLPFGNKVVVFGGDFRQCSPMVSRGSWGTIVSMALSRSVLWREVRVLILTENMGLRANPFFRPYAEYLLRVDNGQEFSIIDHFPPKADTKPLVGVEIALYPEIHQAPSLDTLIHVVFPALAINYANQRYMDGQAILTTKNTVVNSLDTHITKVMLGQEHVFLSTNSVETGDDQAMAIGMEFLNTITLIIGGALMGNIVNIYCTSPRQQTV